MSRRVARVVFVHGNLYYADPHAIGAVQGQGSTENGCHHRTCRRLQIFQIPNTVRASVQIKRSLVLRSALSLVLSVARIALDSAKSFVFFPTLSNCHGDF